MLGPGQRSLLRRQRLARRVRIPGQPGPVRERQRRGDVQTLISTTPCPSDACELIAAGWRLIGTNEHVAALAQLRAACTLAPDDQAAHFLCGVCHHALGQLSEALAAFDTAAALDPANRDAAIAPIGLLCELGRADEALARCERLIAGAPDDPEFRFSAGLVRETRGELAFALACYDAALEREPRHRPSLLNRGLVLTRMGRLEEAYASNRIAADAFPALADSHYNLAEVALALGCHADALEHCERALAIDPRHLGALFDRALALAAQCRFDPARAAWAAARAVDAAAVDKRWASVAGRGVPPRFSPETVYLAQAYARLRECDWGERERFVETLRELVAERRQDLPTERGLVFASTTLPLSAGERLALARAVSTHIQRGVGAPLPPRPASAAGRLRIGYLSPDFRDHVVGRLVRPLLEHHDRSVVEVFAYSLAPDDGSALRRALAVAADRFRDVSALDDRTAAAAIAGDGIDILVDLAGYTDGARPEILALRPAPVQLTYLGFAGSTGADYIDYALTDRVTTPAGSECWWSEQLAFLPHTHFLYEPRDPPDSGPVSRKDYGLPSDAVVFCAFHSAHKIGPETFAAWVEILRRTPGSVLWLLDSGAAARIHLRRAAAAAGIDPARLVEAPREPVPRYLARLGLSDLFLDAFHYNAMAGTCDALWMGLPVLTLTGAAPPARVATSLLAAAGLGDLAASDRESLIERAVALARASGQRQALRERVRAAHQSPLFDARRRVRDIEAAYREMAARARDGLPPASFELWGNGRP
jgi:predicted O-linked N-acetylglucosamine transferase (SPINDLY family)